MFHDFQIKDTSFKNVWMQEKIKKSPTKYQLLLIITLIWIQIYVFFYILIYYSQSSTNIYNQKSFETLFNILIMA